jgi:hypothetical protein
MRTQQKTKAKSKPPSNDEPPRKVNDHDPSKDSKNRVNADVNAQHHVS